MAYIFNLSLTKLMCSECQKSLQHFHLSLTKLFMQTNPGVPDWDSSDMPVFVPDLLQVNKNHETYRGSYMSAHVLLNLSNKLGKR